MPTIPLYETPENADAWHRVTAPGGYELWRFDCDDAARMLQLWVGFFDGDVSNEQYRRAFRRYVRRPTRTTPPLPRDYPAVHVRLTGSEGFEWFADAPHPPGSFGASFEPPAISVGHSSASWDRDGTVRLVLGRLPISGVGGATLEADLTIQCTAQPDGTSALKYASEGSGVDHFSLGTVQAHIAGSLRQMSGGKAVRVIEIDGEGTYQHRFGTGPLHWG
jgi:hypothetical protein